MELDYSKIAAKGFPQPIGRMYLFQGSDDALKREAVARLTTPLLDESMADFDREERDAPSSAGASPDFVRQILASAAGMPMMSERRVVVVANVQRLGKEEQETLAAGLAHLGDRSLLVLIAGAPEYEAGRVKGRSAIGAKLANAVAKTGHVVVCEAPNEGDLSARARAMAIARGKTIEPNALRCVLERAKSAAADRGGGGKGGDLLVLTNELEKLMAYVGDRETITVSDARAVGLTSVDENVFALLDAIGHRDAQRALNLADEMLSAGDKPDGVAARTFVMLARHLRLLWGAKYLAEKRVPADRVPAEVQSLLSGEMLGITQRQSYRLRSYQDQAKGWTYSDLHNGLVRTLTSDMAMKGIAPIKEISAGAPGEDAASNLRLLVAALCT